MANYEKEIRPTVEATYMAAMQGDFTKAFATMDSNPHMKPFLRVPFETMRIANALGERDVAQACIDRILNHTLNTDSRSGISLKISFLAEVAKEQTNYPELYTVDDVAETLIRAIDTLSEAGINTNEYFYGQQEGVHNPGMYWTNDVCNALSQIGSATMHFARERVTAETPPDTIFPLASRIATMLQPSPALQDKKTDFQQLGQDVQAMKLKGMQGPTRQTYVENFGEEILLQLIIQYEDHLELSFIAAKAQEEQRSPSATMELAPEVKKLYSKRVS